MPEKNSTRVVEEIAQGGFGHGARPILEDVAQAPAGAHRDMGGHGLELGAVAVDEAARTHLVVVLEHPRAMASALRSHALMRLTASAVLPLVPMRCTRIWTPETW